MNQNIFLKYFLFLSFLFYKSSVHTQIPHVQSLPTIKSKVETSKHYPTGVFTSFQQFLDNAPAIHSFKVLVNKKSNLVEIFGINGGDSTGILIQNVWGIAVGNELYKYEKGNLYPIENEKGRFVLSRFVDSKKRSNRALFWRNNIGSRMNEKSPYNEKNIFVVEDSNGLRTQVKHLDMKTGKLTN